MSSDIENTMVVEIPVDSEDTGAIAIPAKKLLDTVRFIPEQPLLVNVNTDEKFLEIGISNAHYKLTGEDANEYPKLPQLDNAQEVAIPSVALERAISNTIFAVGNDESRKAMTGVYCQIDSDGATFVGTDAQRLVRYIRRDVKTDETCNFILPKKALTQLKSSLGGFQGDVEMKFNKNNCSFKFNDIYVICRLIDATYPEYNNVIPKENPNKMTIAREDIINTLKRLTPYTNKTTYQVVFNVEGSKLTCKASDVDFSNEGVEELTVNYNGEDMLIGFNSKFLSEILSVLSSEEVTFELSTPSRAGLIIPAVEDENENTLTLLMPIMVSVI